MRDRKDRVHGPYKHGDRWRVVRVAANGERGRRSFETEAQALAYISLYRSTTDTRTVKAAVDAFIVHHKNRGLRFNTTTRMEYHLDSILKLARNGAKPLRVMKPALGEQLYADLQTEVAVDTHRGALAVARAWGLWCVKQGWLKVSPFTDVEAMGRRKKGKPQPRIDEARVLMDKCLELGATGDRGAVATLIALLIGTRATETSTRVVRDVDDGGRLLWIPDSKTEAGKRTVEVPDVLQPLLVAMTEGLDRDAPLFVNRDGEMADRQWFYYHCKRLCALAQVPKDVGPHSLRGFVATVSRVEGATAHQVAAQLGHASTSMQDAYVDRRAVEAAQRRQAFSVLSGGKR